MKPKKKEIREELDVIQNSNGGLLRPRDVVEFARNPETALHGEFEWDDTRAAYLHRLDQAGRLIRIFVVKVTPLAPSVRTFVSLRNDRRNGGGYRRIDDVMSDEELRGQMLKEALDELRVFQRKYKFLLALQPIWNALEEVRAKSGVAAANPSETYEEAAQGRAAGA